VIVDPKSEPSRSPNGEKDCRLDDRRISVQLLRLQEELDRECLSVGDLVRVLRGRGYLLLIIILAVPFMQPIPLLGLSTVFGALIVLIAVRMAFGQKPWIPAFLLNRSISRETAQKVLGAGARWFGKIEKFIRPRMNFFQKPGAERVTVLVITACAMILLLPLPVPFSNNLPALGIVFMAVGMMERDGLFIMIGYFWGLVTAAYLVLNATAVAVALRELVEYLQGIF